MILLEVYRRVEERFNDENMQEFESKYIDLQIDFFEKHNLPQLHLWECFVEGDASEEQLDELAERGLIERHKDEDENAYSYDFDKLDKMFAEELEKIYPEK
jgi:hypothetical protein